MRSSIAWLPLAVALASPPALARAQVEFSRDGRFVVWTESTTDEPSEDPSDTSKPSDFYHATVARVHDLCTGAELGAYLVALRGPDNDRLRKTLKKKSEYDGWRAAHPLVRAACGVFSPDRHAQAFLMSDDGECTFSADPKSDVLGEGMSDDGAGPCQEANRAGLRRGGFYVRRGPSFFRSLAAEGQLPFSNLEVYPCWSLDGAWVGWIKQEIGMRNAPASFTVGQAIGRQARFEVRANPELVPGRLGEVVRLLTEHGQQPVRTGAADTRRERSVVYARPGHEAEAAMLACLVPGGATTAPLDWKTDVDVVVALGSSAAGK